MSNSKDRDKSQEQSLTRQPEHSPLSVKRIFTAIGNVAKKPYAQLGLLAISIKPLVNAIYWVIDIYGNMGTMKAILDFLNTGWGTVTLMVIGFSLIAWQIRKQQKQPQSQSESLSELKDGEKPQSMNELIREAARAIPELPCGAKWLHGIAEADKQGIQNAVKIRGIDFRNEIEPGRIPYVDFVFSVSNQSVYEITVDDAVDGYIRFHNEELTREKKIVETTAHDCQIRDKCFFTIRQWLSQEQADFIMQDRNSERPFWFDNLIITVRGGSNFPDITPRRLEIPGYVSRKDTRWWNANF